MAMISVQDLTFGYDGSPELLFEHVYFQLDTDWRLGFVGRNGRGKTTFLRLLMGQYEYRGSISAPVAFDYFPFPVEDEGESGGASERKASVPSEPTIEWAMMSKGSS